MRMFIRSCAICQLTIACPKSNNFVSKCLVMIFNSKPLKLAPSHKVLPKMKTKAQVSHLRSSLRLARIGQPQMEWPPLSPAPDRSLHICLPGVGLQILQVADSAGVLLSAVWCESNTLGEVELPSLFEGQVCLLGVWDLHTILQELDADVRGVEATHVTDQGVVLPMFPWVTAVHLHLGGRFFGLHRAVNEHKYND